MKKAIIMALLLGAVAAVHAYADNHNYCPLHTYATCYNTGEISDTGSGAHKWHCTCGDDVWVR
jgi:hypothetical protein